MDFLETSEGILLTAIIGLAISCIILYNVIKSAIKDAFKEMKKSEAPPPPKSTAAPTWNKAQIDLQARYEKGEINLEEYNKEWNKL